MRKGKSSSVASAASGKRNRARKIEGGYRERKELGNRRKGYRVNKGVGGERGDPLGGGEGAAQNPNLTSNM